MNFKKSYKVICCVLLGNIILAFGFAGFVLPSGMIAGGSTGIAITFQHYFKLDISIAVSIINVILFIIGAYVLGKKFAFTTILSTCCYPVFLSFFTSFQKLQHLTENPLLSAIYGGILIGIGIGLVLKMGSSTGGMDIPPLILNKSFHIPIALSMYIFDVFILLSQAMFSNSEQILYGILMVLITSIVLNWVILSGRKKIQLFIISKNYIEIKNKLLHDLDVGLTMVDIETAYKEIKQQAIICVTDNRKVYEITEEVQKTDKNAFIIMGQINEVRGKGFTASR